MILNQFLHVAIFGGEETSWRFIVLMDVVFGGRPSRRLGKYHAFGLSRYCWGGLFLHLMLRNCLGWGGWGDDNVPWTCTHIWCCASVCGGVGGGMITFLGLVHTFDATQLCSLKLLELRRSVRSLFQKKNVLPPSKIRTYLPFSIAQVPKWPSKNVEKTR